MEILKSWRVFLSLLVVLGAVGFGNSETFTIEKSSRDSPISPSPRTNFRTQHSGIQALGQPPFAILANDTSYEQLTCVGFNPSLNLLSATIEVKRPDGFNGGLCTNGSLEYVRFWVSYDSSTWNSIGYVTVNTHDLDNSLDCQKNSTKPLFYTLSTKFEPKQELCSHPVLPKIRATLSWNELPPDDPSWSPVWGNRIDNYIQSLPQRSTASEIYTTGLETLPRRTLFGKLSGPLDRERALWPLSLGRRFRDGFSFLRMSLTKKGDRGTKLEERFSWSTQRNDPSVQTSKWEEVTCLGLDWGTSSLIATVHIKAPKGYDAPPCDNKRAEYVSFWADFGDTCKWTFLGTSQFLVHDYESSFPSGGLSYTAVMPVDLRKFSAPCKETRIVRVRVSLAFNEVPPDPPAVASRGNVLEAHVHLQPYSKTNNPKNPDIRYIGNVDLQNIDTAATGTGLTLEGIDVPVTFSGIADPWLVGTGLARGCPFGGSIIVRGNPVLGNSYRVMARPFVSPTDTSAGVAINAPIRYYDPLAPLGTKTVYPNPEGWFEYSPTTENFENTIANWVPAHDGPWQIRVELGDLSFNSLNIYTDWYKVMVNNLGPTARTVHVSLSNTGGPICGDWKVGDEVTGTFDVDSSSPYFGAYSFHVLPDGVGFNLNPVTLPNSVALGYPTKPVAPGNPQATWFVKTTSAIPCGYVITLTGIDRTIVNSQASFRFTYQASIGFCLRAKNAASHIAQDEL